MSLWVPVNRLPVIFRSKGKWKGNCPRSWRGGLTLSLKNILRWKTRYTASDGTELLNCSNMSSNMECWLYQPPRSPNRAVWLMNQNIARSIRVSVVLSKNTSHSRIGSRKLSRMGSLFYRQRQQTILIRGMSKLSNSLTGCNALAHDCH